MLTAACGNAINNNGTQEELTTIFTLGDYYLHSSVSNLASEATDIVMVEVLDERTEYINIWLPPQNELEDTGEGFQEIYRIHTVNQLRVLEVFEGNKELGDIFEVKQLGGQMGNIDFVNLDKVALPIGDELILFLYSLDIENMPSVLVNPTQSAYRFIDGRARGTGYELESLNTYNDLTLTLEDLIQISNKFSN